MADQEYRDAQFELTANHALSWQTSAHHSVEAANILRRTIEEDDAAYWRGDVGDDGKPLGIPNHNTVRPTLMLYAFAVESLAKAVRIGQGVRATEPGPRLSKTTIAHHRIMSLVNATLVAVDDSDLDLLERMERLTETGRYPVQMKPQQHRTADAIFVVPDLQRSIAILQRLELRLCELVGRTPCDLDAL